MRYKYCSQKEIEDKIWSMSAEEVRSRMIRLSRSRHRNMALPYIIGRNVNMDDRTVYLAANKAIPYADFKELIQSGLVDGLEEALKDALVGGSYMTTTDIFLCFKNSSGKHPTYDWKRRVTKKDKTMTTRLLLMAGLKIGTGKNTYNSGSKGRDRVWVPTTETISMDVNDRMKLVKSIIEHEEFITNKMIQEDEAEFNQTLEEIL